MPPLGLLCPRAALRCFQNHMGGFGGGHYTAYAMNRNQQSWYLFDDSHVSPVVRVSCCCGLASADSHLAVFRATCQRSAARRRTCSSTGEGRWTLDRPHAPQCVLR